MTVGCPAAGVTMTEGGKKTMISLVSLKRIIRCTVSAGCLAEVATLMEQGHTSEDIVESMTWKFKAIALIPYWNCVLT